MDLMILVLLTVHYVADWPLQNLLPGNVAIRKSHDWKALLLHTVTYSICFLPWGWKFVLVTFVAHTVTDAITSRLTTRLWFMPVAPFTSEDIAYQAWPLVSIRWTHFTRFDVEKRAVFFNTIGFDQLLHAAQLILTLRLLA